MPPPLPAPPGLKQCYQCRQCLPLEAFYLSKNSRDGYRHGCKICVNAMNRKYYLKDPLKRIESGKQYWQRNKAIGRQKHAEYYQRNKQMIRARIKRNKTVQSRIYDILRGRLQKLITKKRRTFNYLGCDLATFIRYIEGLWQPGMSWETYGAYRRGGERRWHIDHIRPCATFDLTDDAECMKAFNWLNCQPMWAVDNMAKGAYDGWLDGFDPGI